MRRVLLRVRRDKDCPIFQLGDQMVLDLPGVDLASSSKICPFALARFIQDLDPSACEQAQPLIERGTFECPRSSSPVLFDVEALPDPVEAPVGTLVSNFRATATHLRTIPIFRPMPSAFLVRLARRIRLQRHQDRDVILQKGHPGRAFFIIKDGSVDIVGFAGESVSSVVTHLRTGDCFGEMSILTGAPIAVNVEARGPVELYRLEKTDFNRLLRENPFMASRFTRLMAQRLAAANYRIVQEGSRSFSGKLSVMSLPTVVQVLADSSRSGKLRLVDYKGREGSLGFSEGRIFTATVRNLTGEEAFYRLIRWDEGDFSFDSGSKPEQDEIQVGVMNLLLEGMRRIDEGVDTEDVA